MNNFLKGMPLALVAAAGWSVSASAQDPAQNEVVWNDDAAGAFLAEDTSLEPSCEPDWGASEANLREDCVRGLVSALNRNTESASVPVTTRVQRRTGNAGSGGATARRAAPRPAVTVQRVPAHCVPVEDNRLDLCMVFPLGSAALTGAAREQVGVFARRIVADGVTTPLTIEGHTDISGESDRNQELSLERAKAVVAYMVELGVPESQLSAVGFGSSKLRPELSNPNDPRHRRVEIVRPEQVANSGS